jgi:hypothetical protein
MSEPKKTGWPGFGYFQIPEVLHRKTMRTLRTARRDLQRFFESRGYPEFAMRLAAIRANPRNNGERKRQLFEVLQNDYITEVRKRQTLLRADESAVAVPSPVAAELAEASVAELPDESDAGIEVGVP